jgi:G6PDH family F420-dependent oxidoreductase
MPRYGYTLWSELNGPIELVNQAIRAEETGFDFLVISDHFHPWLDSHTDSPFAWSVLGAVADRTERVDLATLVTCPMIRYHPAIVAQAAATIAIMSGGRFTLGVGAGENLNEHVVGRGWPPVQIRHEILEESIEAMRRLWTGQWTSYRGNHVTVEDARLYTCPPVPPEVLVAASGPASAALAAQVGDGLVAVKPDPDLVARFRTAGGQGKRTHGQVTLSFDRDETRARKRAMEFRFGVSGWKVMAELRNPANFEAATATVREEDVAKVVVCGSDAEAYVQAIRQFLDAGFEEVCVVQIGHNVEGFFKFWANAVRPQLPD